MPRAARGGDVRLDPTQFRDLMRSLQKMEGGKVLRRRLTQKLRRAAEPIKRQAQQEAAWSTRIPPAIGVSVLSSRKQSGVFLRVNTTRAPHARPYEGMTGGTAARGSFRHPVFGTSRWVTQQTRPFLQPAVDAARGRVERAVTEAVDEATREAGF